KRTLDAKGHCMLEMPSGTGKTVTLLSLIVAYKQKNPQTGKLVYCSRTVGEIEKTLEELKAVMAAREKELGRREDFTAMGLTSRRNLCLHDKVSKEKKGKVVDARCRNMTASWVREAAGVAGEGAAASAARPNGDVELCEYYEGFFNHGKETL